MGPKACYLRLQPKVLRRGTRVALHHWRPKPPTQVKVTWPKACYLRWSLKRRRPPAQATGSWLKASYLRQSPRRLKLPALLRKGNKPSTSDLGQSQRRTHADSTTRDAETGADVENEQQRSADLADSGTPKLLLRGGSTGLTDTQCLPGLQTNMEFHGSVPSGTAPEINTSSGRCCSIAGCANGPLV